MKEKTVSFEEAVDSQNDQIRKIHREEQKGSLSASDEFQILSGRKIKYTTIDGGLTLLIRPLKAREFDKFLELSILVQKGFTREVLAKVFERFSEFIQDENGKPVDIDLLWDNVEVPDIVSVVNLIRYSISNADKLFKKKVITLQEVEK